MSAIPAMASRGRAAPDPGGRDLIRWDERPRFGVIRSFRGGRPASEPGGVSGRGSSRMIALMNLGLLALLAAAPPVTAGSEKPFPGKESQWHGFTRHDFRVDGANVI